MTKDEAKSTPANARVLGQVVAGDSAELPDGDVVLVAWQWGEVTMIHRPGEKPREGPRPLLSTTPILSVRRRERANIGGCSVDPLRGRV